MIYGVTSHRKPWYCMRRLSSNLFRQHLLDPAQLIPSRTNPRRPNTSMMVMVLDRFCTRVGALAAIRAAHQPDSSRYRCELEMRHFKPSI